MKTLISFLLLVLSCSAEQVRAYFGTGSDGIYSSLLDTKSGAVTKAEKFADIQNPNFLTINNGFLYSATNEFKKNGGMSAFKIEKNGELTFLNSVPTNGAGNCHVSLDKTGKHVFFAHYSGGSSGSIPLEDDGSLSETIHLMKHKGSSVNKKRQRAPHPHSIYAGPENKFVYVPDLGTDEVWTYSFNQKSGALELVDKAAHPAGGGPRHMKFSINGKQAYVLSEMTLHTVIYDRNPETGKLTIRESVNNLAEEKDKTSMSCSEIRVSPDGKFAYVANRDLANQKRDSISVFSIQEDGGLQLIQEAYAEVWIPRNINLSPDGKWLLVAGQKSNEISVFSIDKSSGKLTFNGNKIAVPKAMCVEFSESK